MAELVVRKLEGKVKANLQRRARRNGRSMEEEVRDILRNAVNEGHSPTGLGTEISRLFSKVGLRQDVRELRGYPIKPPSFKR